MFDEVIYNIEGVNPDTAYIAGCMNPEADNYNSSATMDDGSCTFDSQFGCTIQGAQNYDPSAQADDGSCVFVPTAFEPENITYGCTYAQATNYNPQAEVDDGSCTFTADSCSMDGGGTPTSPIGT